MTQNKPCATGDGDDSPSCALHAGTLIKASKNISRYDLWVDTAFCFSGLFFNASLLQRRIAQQSQLCVSHNSNTLISAAAFVGQLLVMSCQQAHNKSKSSWVCSRCGQPSNCQIHTRRPATSHNASLIVFPNTHHFGF